MNAANGLVNEKINKTTVIKLIREHNGFTAQHRNKNIKTKIITTRTLGVSRTNFHYFELQSTRPKQCKLRNDQKSLKV